MPFSEFPTIFYRISKFTENYNKQVPIALFICVLGYADNPLGFCFFHPEVLGPVWEGEQGREHRIPAACGADGEGKGARELEGTTAHL